MDDNAAINEVVVVGSLMIDLNAYCHHLPIPNETIKGTSFMQSYGGKGSNQSVQCARLGVTTSMIGCVGDDTFGTSYIEQLNKEHVRFLGKKCAGNTTGIAHITISDDGKNTITIIPGANNELTEHDVNSNSNIIATSKVLLCQNEIPTATTIAALTIAHDNNVLSIFNPAPAEPLEKLINIMTLADIIIPNEVELATLTGLPTLTEIDIEIASRKLMDITSCKAIITTLGDRGCFLLYDDLNVFIHTDSVKCIDAVGAGDSFIGALAASLSRCKLTSSNLLDSITKALYCASQSVTRKGAQVSYVTKDELMGTEFLPPPPCR